jgi:hypothetical protein
MGQSFKLETNKGKVQTNKKYKPFYKDPIVLTLSFFIFIYATISNYGTTVRDGESLLIVQTSATIGTFLAWYVLIVLPVRFLLSPYRKKMKDSEKA